MTVLSVLLINLIGLAFVTVGLMRSGQRAQVLVYAFILGYFAQLFTLRAMLAVHRSSRWPHAKEVVSRLSRRPVAERESYPLTHHDTNRPAGFGGYVFVMLVMAFFAFMLVNVNADRELDLDARTLAGDLGWALAIAGVYWLMDLASRAIVIDFSAPAAANYGYNTRDLAVIAFAVLTSGAVVVIRQSLKTGASGWVVLGPLLAWRTLYDVLTGVALARRTRTEPDRAG